MVINKIITQNELNYIETLYLYANLEDFITYKSSALDHYIGQTNQLTHKKITKKYIDNMYGAEKYIYMLEYVHDTMLHTAEYLGNSSGRDWYKFDNYRLGIMSYDTAKKSNQFNVEIQYTQGHLFSLGNKLKGLKLPFEGNLNQYHIKRVDVTQIVKTPKDYLTNHGFISPYRSIDRHDKNNRTETVYLGHRKSGNVFRMYNKTIELKVDTKLKPMDYKKIELFSSYFGDIEDLYTFELEMHRKYLKPTFGIDTLADLEKVYKAHKDIVGKIKIYEDNDQNRNLIEHKHHDRIKTFQLVEYKELPRLKKKKYKTSKNYMIDKAVTAYKRYELAMPEPLALSEKLSLADEIISQIFETKDISIELSDSQYVEDYKAFIAKVESMRINQDDQLFKEANQAFAPIMTQTAKELF